MPSYAEIIYWDNHTFQVLINTCACLFKFTQGRRGEEEDLLGTRDIIIEAAPADGSFGVAVNTHTFLTKGEQIDSYSLQSVDDTDLSFTIEAGPHKGKVITRPRRHANSLGKALVLCKIIIMRRRRG